jgi:hypothetical protein
MVARRLKAHLGSSAHKTLSRMTITTMLREASGLESTRLKSELALQLEACLSHEGVVCYPHLSETTTGDVVRLYHAGTVGSRLVDIITNPAAEEDAELGVLITKIKGRWDYSTSNGHAAGPERVAP